MKWLKQIEYYFFPLRKPDLEVEALIKECEESKKTPKDISEPVVTFAEILKSEPERFSFIAYYGLAPYYHNSYKLKDKKTNNIFNIGETKFAIISRYGASPSWEEISRHKCKECGFLTTDEIKYLQEAFAVYIKARAELKKQKLKIRSDRARQRYVDIYC